MPFFFVNGCLTVIWEEPEDVMGHMLQHLQELIEDAQAYGWRSVRDYNAGWLQQLEQERELPGVMELRS